MISNDDFVLFRIDEHIKELAEISFSTFYAVRI